MAQPHKGDRALIMVRTNQPVYNEVKAAAAARGISMSQYVSDVLAQHTGHHEFVRELDQKELPLGA